MLETGKEVDPELGRDGGIRRAIWKRVDEGGAPSPIFVRRVRQEDLRHHVVGPSAIEETAFCSRPRIRRRQIGEWEHVGWKEDRRRWLGIARRLGKTVIEAAAPRACHVREHTVERDAALLVGIEALVEHLAQE